MRIINVIVALLILAAVVADRTEFTAFGDDDPQAKWKSYLVVTAALGFLGLSYYGLYLILNALTLGIAGLL